MWGRTRMQAGKEFWRKGPNGQELDRCPSSPSPPKAAHFSLAHLPVPCGERR